MSVGSRPATFTTPSLLYLRRCLTSPIYRTLIYFVTYYRATIRLYLGLKYSISLFSQQNVLSALALLSSSSPHRVSAHVSPLVRHFPAAFNLYLSSISQSLARKPQNPPTSSTSSPSSKTLISRSPVRPCLKTLKIEVNDGWIQNKYQALVRMRGCTLNTVLLPLTFDVAQ